MASKLIQQYQNPVLGSPCNVMICDTISDKDSLTNLQFGDMVFVITAGTDGNHLFMADSTGTLNPV